MEYILVTLNYSKSSGVDMKIPVFMTVEEFVGIICEIYNVKGTTLQSEPQGILLSKKLSFAEQQVEHGTLLTIVES